MFLHPALVSGLKGKFYNKSGAFAFFALHQNRTIHQVNIPFRNRHAKSRTLIMGPCAGFLLRKFIKNVLHKFLTHTHTGICHAVSHLEMAVIFPWMISCFKYDPASVICKFHRIAQNIHQNLPDPDCICKDIRVLRFFPSHFKLNLPVRQKSVCNVCYYISNLCDIRRNRAEFCLAAFNTADVQYIVDQGKQMFGTVADFFQTSSYFRLWFLF